MGLFLAEQDRLSRHSPPGGGGPGSCADGGRNRRWRTFWRRIRRRGRRCWTGPEASFLTGVFHDHCYILAAILIFGVLIAVHELGHFLAAKLCGVRVNEFSIGMGPLIWHKGRRRPSTPSGCCPSAASAPWRGRTRTQADERSLGRRASGKGADLRRRLFHEFSGGFLIILVVYSGTAAF